MSAFPDQGWPYTSYTPYDVLHVATISSIAEIRTAFKKRALETHPDKVNAAREATHVHFPFTTVKEAAEILLDPVSRRAYDSRRSQDLVRESGAVSDVYSLAEDFSLVSSPSTQPVVGGHAAESVWLYQMECRCGGIYEVACFTDPAEQPGGPQPQKAAHRKRCECDCCSLVVEVDM